MGSFKSWLIGEGKDIFGFEGRTGRECVPPAISEDPVASLASDVIVELMMSREVGGLTPVMEFSNQVRWGEGAGAVEAVMSPLGSYKTTIRRMQPDLEGRNVWTCRKVVPYKAMLERGGVLDERVGWMLLEEVERVRRQDIEAPSRDYKGLPGLVRKASLAFQRKGTMPEIFIYRGVKEVVEARNYLVAFELRGQGVEAPGRARVEEFVVNMSYDPDAGMIRVFGHDVQSKARGHQWYPKPSEWDEKFSSGQEEREIIECIGGALSAY